MSRGERVSSAMMSPYCGASSPLTYDSYSRSEQTGSHVLLPESKPRFNQMKWQRIAWLHLHRNTLARPKSAAVQKKLESIARLLAHIEEIAGDLKQQDTCRAKLA